MASEKAPAVDLTSGTAKAAVLLLTLGEEDAAEILKHMGPKEVQKVGGAMATLSNISKEQVDTVLEEFITIVGSQTSLGVGADDYIRKTMINALGEDKAGALMDRILLGGSASGLEQLKWLDSRGIAEMIRLEHPQIIAIVLSYLESDQAGAVLQLLPENVRSDLILRVATLDTVQPSAIQELNIIMEKQFAGGSGVQSTGFGGLKVAADILNFLDGSVEEKVMANIKKTDEDMATQIEDLMFVFDNIKDVDDRGMQALMREVSSDALVLALKGCDAELKQQFIGNMSKRAAEMLVEDLETRGPVKLSEVEGAQKEILAIVRRMSESGEIILGGGGGGEEYV
ncbi:MAG: flagellar motor switch protein FliG [Gammaproteobacteria bacterium]|nr:flagellar motor switch protein FliG [Gammaproteobacteria bacterium]PCH62700.1 MAG: flagellar motor switch protein FliG [Gammaproteobacteria bacterium]PCH64145.1 MAG: flagellar motor switch protein FliG [Gammaproteobacteria bacterium]